MSQAEVNMCVADLYIHVLITTLFVAMFYLDTLSGKNVSKPKQESILKYSKCKAKMCDFQSLV